MPVLNKGDPPMRTAMMIVLMFGLASVANAGRLDGLEVRVQPSLTHFSKTGSYLDVGVEVSNSAPVDWYAVVFECVGFADGLPVSQSIGVADKIAAYKSEYSNALLSHFSKPPTSVSCRVTHALEQSLMKNP